MRQFGHALQRVSDATTARVRGGGIPVADGRLAEAEEQIADVIECAFLDEAIDVAARHPVAVRDDRGEALWAE